MNAFPWLDYEHMETEEGLGGEVEVHTLRVWVNDFGKAFLTVEEFYANGPAEREEPADPRIPNDAFTQEEAGEFAMQGATDRDPYR